MRLFVEKLASGEVIVGSDEHHYVSRVRRARVGLDVREAEQEDGERVDAREEADARILGPAAPRARRIRRQCAHGTWRCFFSIVMSPSSV